MKKIYSGGSGEITEKKSRFIADVFPVSSEAEAAGYINEVKKKYRDARHHCFAYVIGENNELARFSDDGEPSGTAGKPILDILLASEIGDCLIVVTRYFGGTLLGTGGLLRAYQSVAKAGIAGSRVVAEEEGLWLALDADYSQLGRLQHICAEQKVICLDTAYSDVIHMELLVRRSAADTLLHEITEQFCGTLQVTQNGIQRFAMADEEVILLSGPKGKRNRCNKAQ